MSVLELLATQVRERPSAPALIDGSTGDTITYGELDVSARAAATALAERGLEAGTRLGVVADNSVDLALTYLGCLYAGVVVVPVNPLLTDRDVQFCLEDVSVSGLLIDGKFADRVDRLGLTDRAQVLSIGPVEGTDFTAWNPRGSQPSTRGLDSIEASSRAVVVYTSGTTSQPKGVVHSVDTLFGNARAFCSAMGIDHGNRFFNILPMTYLGGYYNLLMLPLSVGASVVVGRPFDARSAVDFWSPAVSTEVNTLWLVPTVMSLLLQVDRDEDAAEYCQQNIDLALVGTAPLREETRAAFEERYGVTLRENYGLSETLFVSTEGMGAPRVPGGVGRTLDEVGVAVVDADGGGQPYGAEGELLVRSPWMMEGYWTPDGEPNEPLEEGGWFATGDLGSVTRMGDLRVSGRKKDLIIRGGVNVSPTAVEDVLLEHPAVQQSVVVGLPHPLLGEEIVAVVSLGESGSEDAMVSLKQWASEQLGPTRAIAHFLEIEEMPFGPTGKLLRREVRAMAEERIRSAAGSPDKAEPRSAMPETAIPGSLRPSLPRVDVATIEELAAFSTSVVSDCLNRQQAMDTGIRAFAPGTGMCGQALTVDEVEGGNLTVHVALDMAEPGDVLVVNARGGTSRAIWGELQHRQAELRGVAGVVIDGAVRDVAALRSSPCPLYARGVTPAGPLKGWFGAVNSLVQCGGVAVSPGDLLVGDDDGVVVVPRDDAHRLLDAARSRQSMEAEWSERVDAGESTLDVLGLRKRQSDFGVERRD